MHCNTGKRSLAAAVLPFLSLCAAVFLCFSLKSTAITAHAEAPKGTAENPWVVTLDPGHGGTDLGATYAPFAERFMTLYVAQLINQDLAQYPQIKVNITRSDDVDVSLSQRAALAKQTNSDLFVSLHFNVAPSGTKTGSEVYISSVGSMETYGQIFAIHELNELNAIAGIKPRGIYTRIGAHGDYYGVIRHCTAYNIPSVIVEHCYLNNTTDRTTLSQADIYQKMAQADAKAITDYFCVTQDTAPQVATPVQPAQIEN